MPAAFLCAALLGAGDGQAGDVHAAKTPRPPVIDGALAPGEWDAAVPFERWTQQLPAEGAPPTEASALRVLYDDRALYLAFRLRDRSPADIVARLTRRDRDVGSDSVQLDLDSRGNHREAFHFEVSAAGVQRDAIRTGDQALNYDWDAVWTSAVRIDAGGWTVELAIPLTVLRFEERRESDWRIQARRLIARTNELDAIAFVPRQEHGELSRYLPLDGVAGLPAPRGLELVPFALAQLRQRGSPPGLDWAPGIGLDARYGLTAGMSLDGTVLPDFAQVEADQAVLNLTTFEVQFPEKRPFFLEGAELFSLQGVFGDPLSTQLFYSRRLGAPAPEVEAPAGFAVAGAPARIGLWGAAKVAGKVNEVLSLALMDGVTSAERARLTDPVGNEVLEGIAAPTNFFAGRAQLELPAGWRAGLTLSDARRAEGPSSLGLMGTCPNGAPAGVDGRCTHDATAAALDARWESPSGAWLFGAVAIGSVLSGGPRQVLRDGTTLGPGDAGFGARVELAKASGAWLGDLIYEGYSPRLELNDEGFLATQNLHRVFGRFAYRLFDLGPTRETTFGVELFGRQTWNGRLPIARGLQLNNKTVWASTWETWIELQLFPRTFDNRETRDGAATERAPQAGLEFALSTNPSSPVTFLVEGLAHTTWRGWALEASADVALRPAAQLELSMGPTLERVVGDPRWVGTPGGGAYRFGLQDALAPGATLRSTFTFTPALTLQAYAQLFFASVRYAALLDGLATGPDRAIALDGLRPAPAGTLPPREQETILNLNLVLRYEFLPGSVLYAVFTRAQAGAPDFPVDPPRPRLDLGALRDAPAEQVFLLKLSYYFAR